MNRLLRECDEITGERGADAQRQDRINAAARSFAAIINSPVQCSLGEFATKAEAERALVCAAVSLGNVQGDVVPVVRI